MSIYRVIALVISIIILANAFNVVEPISTFITRIMDIPVIDDYGDKPHLFKLVMHLAYLLVVVCIIKMLLMRNKDE